MVEELNKKEIPDEIEAMINKEISLIDSFTGTDKELIKTINKTYTNILNLVRNKLGLVPKHYYQNLWMALGLSVFGVPFGILWFVASNNPAMFAIGIPLGLPIGIAVGSQKDKKAAKENKQLQIG